MITYCLTDSKQKGKKAISFERKSAPPADHKAAGSKPGAKLSSKLVGPSGTKKGSSQ
jgi:hypothetical protein